MQNAESFVAAVSGMTRIQVEKMPTSAINERNKSLNLKSVFENAKPVKGTCSQALYRDKDEKIAPFILSEDAQI